MSVIGDIRNKSGLSRAEFSREYNIPLRTLEDWESERRTCPEYLVSLLDRAVSEDCKRFKVYESADLLKEMGACYRELLKTMNNPKRNSVHNPYPNADIFPTKYFTMVLMMASKKHIPSELNQRIGNFMNFIDPEDWAESMRKPCPLETRVFFDIGMDIG